MRSSGSLELYAFFRERLTQNHKVELKKMKLAVFDLDGTLIQGNSSFAFCTYLVQRGVLPRSAAVYALWSFLCHTYGKRSLVTLHDKVFAHLLRGRLLSSLEEHVAPFLAGLLPARCYVPALEALRQVQHLGSAPLILSNSPSFLVGAIAAYFGVDDWAASEYGLDERGRLSHIASLMGGEEKAEYVKKTLKRRGIPPSMSGAYSDSVLDLPLLKVVGHPVAVNPDRRLHAIALRNHWQVI